MRTPAVGPSFFGKVIEFFQGAVYAGCYMAGYGNYKSGNRDEPALLAADKRQNIFDVPGYLACGQAGGQVAVLDPDDLIPLPSGSNLFFLPDRSPVGFNPLTQTFENLGGLYPVAAFVSPGHTQLMNAAYIERKKAKTLPLFSYAPVAFWKGGFYVPAVRTDRRQNHDITAVDQKLLKDRIGVLRKSGNRLIGHLAGCACENSCPNAINFFFGRYEAPLPVSPSCNARCLGCISWQPGGSCPATQPRLKFVPTAEEIAEVALLHIEAAREPVVSFGQGCEGEPLLEADVIGQAIRIIRQRTSRGTIHMNTNASSTSRVEALCRYGLDSLRVSLNSAQPEMYARYYRPRGYGFKDVRRSIAIAKRLDKFVSLNYLVMPGFTDREDEFRALRSFVKDTGVDMVQWRNLNYDPLRYFERMEIRRGAKFIGVRPVIEHLRAAFPGLRHGYFNLPKERWARRY